MSGQEIENVNFPGPATTIQGLLKYSDGFEHSQGLNMCWVKDSNTDAAKTNSGFTTRQNYIITNPAPVGTFSFAVPLSHIFGFCEDYDKIVYGMKHMLTLVRKGDDEAIFRANGVGVGFVTLPEVNWVMPRIFPSDTYKYKLYKTIESKASINVGFRMRQCDTISLPQSSSFTWRLSVRSAPERPRFVLIGLQTGKYGNQEQNAALFDHCNVKNMHVVLNSDRYPVEDYNANFTMQRVAHFYKDAADFIPKYRGVFDAHCNIDPQRYPLFVFDFSKQSERLETGNVDVTVKIEFTENV